LRQRGELAALLEKAPLRRAQAKIAYRDGGARAEILEGLQQDEELCEHPGIGPGQELDGHPLTLTPAATRARPTLGKHPAEGKGKPPRDRFRDGGYTRRRCG
jgi:hypothetical protein